jgi:GMP synthase-like glutamine amidotransferase
VRALFIQQDHVSPVGPIGARFTEHGYDVVGFNVVPEEHFAAPGLSVDFPDPLDFDVVVPMGAPWSVYDRATIGSWIADELALLAAAHAAGVPVLGICFGGQALAAALGGSVELAAQAELGWYEIESDDPGLVEPGPWFQWHTDRWNLPPGAIEVARTAQASQAFTLNRSMAVQFHPELVPATLRGWNDNGGSEYLRARGIDPAQLEALTTEQEPAAVARAHRLVDRFLADVATHPLR